VTAHGASLLEQGSVGPRPGKPFIRFPVGRGV
jgi:hypothetical protein